MSEFDESYFRTQYTDYEAQNSRTKLNHYHDVLRARVSGSERTVLDVGCGLGLWAAHLADEEPEWSVTGMDVDAAVVAENALRFPDVTFLAGRAGEGTPTERYDLLTAMDVLEHVPDVEQQFEKICRWVEPGGVMAFVVPVYDGPLGPLVHLLDKDPTHIHKWGRRRWLELADRHLKDIEWHGVFRLLLPWGYYVHHPSRSLRSVAPAIMVTGRLRSHGAGETE